MSQSIFMVNNQFSARMQYRMEWSANLFSSYIIIRPETADRGFNDDVTTLRFNYYDYNYTGWSKKKWTQNFWSIAAITITQTQ